MAAARVLLLLLVVKARRGAPSKRPPWLPPLLLALCQCRCANMRPQAACNCIAVARGWRGCRVRGEESLTVMVGSGDGECGTQTQLWRLR
jgi:hypothetical protein